MQSYVFYNLKKKLLFYQKQILNCKHCPTCKLTPIVDNKNLIGHLVYDIRRLWSRRMKAVGLG